MSIRSLNPVCRLVQFIQHRKNGVKEQLQNQLMFSVLQNILYASSASQEGVSKDKAIYMLKCLNE